VENGFLSFGHVGIRSSIMLPKAQKKAKRAGLLKLSRRNRIVIIDATACYRKRFPGFLGCFAGRIWPSCPATLLVHKTANTLDKMPKKKSCGRSSGDKQS
jgi:ribosomal protein L30/L7E